MTDYHSVYQKWSRLSKTSHDDFILVEYDDGIFFLQAEVGIRVYKVTGVQTCALPIWAGVGASDPPTKTPRPVSDLVADLDAFAAAADARPPYLLVGQSMGANVVFIYAEAHPEKVVGFVAMNPVPPEETFLPAVRKVETKAEFAQELSFNRGENEENTSFHEPMLSNRLPASMPYAVMFDEDCGGDSDFCNR